MPSALIAGATISASFTYECDLGKVQTSSSSSAAQRVALGSDVCDLGVRFAVVPGTFSGRATGPNGAGFKCVE